MNKHIALVLGTIFSLTIILVPFTGAFASSDTSVALPQFVFSLMFQSVTTPTFVDVTNYNAATGTTSSGSSVSLANSVGSYSQINRTGIPISQNLICIKLSITGPSPRLFDDVTIEPYINGSPAHLYGTYTLSDYNNQIDYYMFFYIGEDSLRVKDGSGRDITPWGIRFTTNAVRDYSWSYSSSTTTLYYYNYILQSQTVDPGEAAEIALDIINVLQLSQLSENLGMINTQLDTGNIASMMESMLTYLADIPNIVNILNSIDSSNTDILNAVNLFYTYYNSQFEDFIYTAPSQYYYHDANGTVLNTNTTLNDCYLRMTYKNLEYVNDHYYRILLQGNGDIHVEYSISSGSLNYTYTEPYYFTQFFNNNQYLYIYVYSPYINFGSNNFIIFHFTSDTDFTIFRWGNTNTYIGSYEPLNNTTIFQRIWFTLNQMLNGKSNVPTDVQTTTDDINQNATTVNNFQSSTQQSLDQNLNDVPVVDYQIQATTGTQYMKAYSEALFNASNGFRIWYMLPLILFVIGMLIRWGVKK